MTRKTKIIFVCTGNTCRSVMAEYLFKKMLSDDGIMDQYEVISRGTAASEFYKIPAIVIQSLKEEGITIQHHISSQIERYDIETADIIYVMERHHKEIIDKLYGSSDKVRLLGKNSEEIPDPIGQGQEVYRQTFELIKKHLLEIMKNL